MHIRAREIFLLGISLILLLVLHGQTRQDYVSINKEFRSINSDKSLKKFSLQNEALLEEMTDGGGELSGYYNGKEIKKIVRWIGLLNGNEILEFYFKTGELIFVFEQFNSFDIDPKTDEIIRTKTETTFEGRYYLKNKKLIYRVTTGHNRFEDDTVDTEKTLLDEAKKFLRLLNKKRSNKQMLPFSNI